MARPRIYEEVDVEMKLEELVKMACDLFGPPYDDREKDTLSRRSIREVGRIMHLSEAKVKRLLIEGGWYSTKEMWITPQNCTIPIILKLDNITLIKSYRINNLCNLLKKMIPIKSDSLKL